MKKLSVPALCVLYLFKKKERIIVLSAMILSSVTFDSKNESLIDLPFVLF